MCPFFPPLHTSSPPPAVPVAEYAEPDLVQANPSSQMSPSTFKPPPAEAYSLPLPGSHYDVPGAHHEYAEPLPPEPEYATPFGEAEPSAASRRSPSAALPVQTTRCRPCPLSHLYHEAW